MSEQALGAGNRPLLQMAASYGIGAWIVLQVADTLSSLIGLPLWFGQVLLVVLVSGFMLVLATGVVQSRSTTGEAGLRGLLTQRNALFTAGGAVVVVVLVTVGYLGMRAVGLGPVGTLQARGVFEEQERLVLADFDGNVEQEGLGETVTTLLRIDLAQSPAFTILEPAQLGPVLQRMQLDADATVTYDVALEAARREGLKAIVTGELLQAGPSIVVSARIVAAGTGEALVAVRETASDAADLPEAVDRVSAQLRERVGESLRTIQGDQPLEQVTTASLDALEKYAQGVRANDFGDANRAIALLNEAIVEDSTFAMAYRKLGIVLTNQNRDLEGGVRAFTRSYELRDRLTDRERWLAEAAYLMYVQDDAPGSRERYETLLESYPNDPTALNNLAIAYNGLGRQEEAAELYLRSFENGGAPATTYSNAIPLIYVMGDTARANELLTEFADLFPGNPASGATRFQIRSALFDYIGAEEAALELYENALGTPAASTQRLAVAQVRLVQGRIEEALVDFTGAIEAIEATGASVGITPAAGEALVGGLVELQYRDDPAAAVRVMDEARARLRVSEGPLADREDLGFAAAYALSGSADRARDMMEAFRDGGGNTSGSEWRAVEGAIAFAEGRPEEAIAIVHETMAGGNACYLCSLQSLGTYFDAAAQPDSAIHYLEEYINSPDQRRLQNSDNLAFWDVVPRLGHLHAEHGEAARARELFELFLAQTERADPPLQAKRDRVRAALEALEN